MKEPKLPGAVKDPKVKIYRLLILPTWGNPISVRFEKKGDSYVLASRRLDGEGGYDIGKLTEMKDVTLNGASSRELDTLLAKMNFFAIPVQDDTRVSDGDEWILEGVSGGKYHMIHRVCISTEKTNERGLESFVHLCEFLIKNSSLSQGPKNRGFELLPSK
jgi:hypothetical protein